MGDDHGVGLVNGLADAQGNHALANGLHEDVPEFLLRGLRGNRRLAAAVSHDDPCHVIAARFNQHVADFLQQAGAVGFFDKALRHFAHGEQHGVQAGELLRHRVFVHGDFQRRQQLARLERLEQIGIRLRDFRPLQRRFVTIGGQKNDGNLEGRPDDF